MMFLLLQHDDSELLSTNPFHVSFVHAVEELMISLDSDGYSVREDVGFFTATITATRAAEFPYTVTVDSADGTAVGKQDGCSLYSTRSVKMTCIQSPVHKYTGKTPCEF